MPEGDTIWRTAARLRPALAGQTVIRFEAPRLVEKGPMPGTLIERVEARGKYLLIDFGDGTTLETHLVMTGSWHLYRVGERWRRSPGAARAVLEASSGWVAVCFSAPHVTLKRSGRARHLGPDLTSPAPDLDAAVKRFDRAIIGTSVGEVLLDQRICCGVGNVYKSEVLHAVGLAPTTRIEDLPLDVRRALVETSHRLLRANLDTGARRTVPEGLAVYGRAGKPCRRCGTAIVRIVQGEHARSTYWCPGCQLLPGVTRPDS